MDSSGTFESQYYESEDFWNSDLLEDNKQYQRILATIGFLPEQVKTILDVGCGNGAFCNYVTDHHPGFQVTGMDRSITALKHVKSKHVAGEIIAIPFPDQSFDCVTCLQVLEHIKVPDYKMALKELARVASTYLLISVPYQEKINENVTKCPSCQAIFNYDLHLRSFDDSTMQNLFNEFGYEMIKSENLGSYRMPKIYSFYLSLISKKSEKQDYLQNFNSPLCPICGYVNDKQVIKFIPEQRGYIENQNETPTQESRTGILKKMAKNIWLLLKPYLPAENHRGYWVLALYKKRS